METPPKLPDFTFDEASAFYGLSVKTIRRAIQNGEMPAPTMVNRRVIRLSRVDLAVWYLSRRPCPKVDPTLD